MGFQVVFDAVIMFTTQVRPCSEGGVTVLIHGSSFGHCHLFLQFLFFGIGWIFFIRKLFKNFEVRATSLQNVARML